LFNPVEMSARRLDSGISPAAKAALVRMAVEAGAAIRTERLSRGLTLREVADRAGLAVSTLHRLEAEEVSTLESYARFGAALSARPELQFTTGRPDRLVRRRKDEDLVHAAMGEHEARHLRGIGFHVSIDEPYQHYRFAGRADVVAWDTARRAMLHLENRTQFPNLQEAAGAFNGKRAYLPAILAERLSIRNGWLSVTHAIVALWSSEVLHVTRLRASTLAALCPDDLAPFDQWWHREPLARGAASVFVLFDPAASVGRRRRYVGLDLAPRVEPRYRDYASAADALRLERSV
jgi:transcriptional regulator with XRE-family HTH domain